MRRFIIGLAAFLTMGLLFFGALHLAGQAYQPEPPARHRFLDDYCRQIADVARLTMEARQNGVAMEVAMESAGNLEVARVLVIEAWKYPRSEGSRDEFVRDFGDLAFRACIS